MRSDYDPGGGASRLSAAGTLVRRADPDRFFTALFAPPARRERLFVLYAFNHELARAREVGREPALALMRLQWWREVVEGVRPGGALAGPLRGALERGELAVTDLLGMIAAREIEAGPSIDTLAEWLEYLRGTAGGVAVAAGRALGMPEPEVLRAPGAAYGAAGVLRSVPWLAAQGRCLLPVDVLAAQGLTREGVMAAPASATDVIRALAALGLELLQPPGVLRLERGVVPAALPAALARRDLRRLPLVRPRGVADRAVVLAAWFRGLI